MSVDNELAKKNMAAQAQKIRENNRIRAEAEARKLLHNQNNIRTYSPAGLAGEGLLAQLQARKDAAGLGKPAKADARNGVTPDAIQNAMANMRAHKGIEAPQFAGETEELPTIEEALSVTGELEEEIAVVEESGTPTYNAFDAARQLMAHTSANAPIKSGQAKGKRGSQLR